MSARPHDAVARPDASLRPWRQSGAAAESADPESTNPVGRTATGASLQLRLNGLITALTVAFLILGTAMVVFHARNHVEAEIQSAQDAVVDLLEATVEIPQTGSSQQATQLEQLAGLGTYRHIDVTLRYGSESDVAPDPDGYRTPDAPRWFSKLVKPPDVVTHRKIRVIEQPPAWLVVRAEPADEIAEAWQGARATLALLIGFALAANILVVTVVHRALRPMARVLEGLHGLEQGRYAARLPRMATPELDQLAQRVNALAGTLEATREKNRGLNRRILDVQEEERRRVARELHDELGQSLTAIQAEAAVIGQSLNAVPSSPDGSAGRMVDESARAIGDETARLSGKIRDLVRRLRPAALDKLGLTAALQELVREWDARTDGLLIELEAEESIDRLSAEVQTALYRIVQEALTNVVRHAGATRTRIRVRRLAGTVTLTVADNGRGLSTHVQPVGAHHAGESGFGLFGIHERAAGLGGRGRIQAVPGRGLVLSVRLPVATA